MRNGMRLVGPIMTDQEANIAARCLQPLLVEGARVAVKLYRRKPLFDLDKLTYEQAAQALTQRLVPLRNKYARRAWRTMRHLAA